MLSWNSRLRLGYGLGATQWRFGDWRAKFKAEPGPLERKLLYRRSSKSPFVIVQVIAYQ